MDGMPAGAGSTSAVAPGVGGAGVDRKCGRPGGAFRHVDGDLHKKLFT